jgi:hypothetical protein
MSTFGTIETEVTIQTYLKFVECCSGTEILFSGSLAIANGSVYLYGGTVPFSGTGGSLQPGRCYTITLLTASTVITYPVAPPIGLISLTSGCGAETCFNCNTANPCDCPEGYKIVDGFCIGVETIDPIPPISIVFTGNTVDDGGGSGLVTFQSLNNFVWPLFTTPQLLGDIAAMTIIPNTGNNPVTGDSWTALNPLPQTGIDTGKHQPIITATPGGFPAVPSPPNPPPNPPLRPLRESTITGTTLNYGAGNPIGYDNYISNTSPWNIWYTTVAVWTLPETSVINQYAGFLVCLEPTVETTYQIIMTGNNGIRLFVDDYLAVEMLNGDGNFQALAYNNHFQITLSPGLHILRLECYNYTGGGGLAAEVLECSAATVYGFTSLADFIPYRKFSTLWKKSRNLQITATGNNVITLTSGTTLPTDTSGFIVQTSGTGFPANTFVISVINSTTYIVNQNVPNGVYNSCRIQFAYDVSSIASNSFSCPNGYTLTTCNGIACTKILELPCSNNCYLVIPCNNTDSFVSNNFELEEFINLFVTIETENFYGCAYIIKLDDNKCKDAVEVTLYPDEICDCELRCFYISNSNGFLYVDENDVLQEVSSIEANPYIKVCSKIYPVIQNDSRNYEIINFGDCVNNTCPEQCFKLTECVTETIIYSNTASLLEHAVNNNIITINGEEGCWEVTESIANCDCINVTFTGPFGTDTYTANSIGTYEGANLYEFTANNGDVLYIYKVFGKGWYISTNGYGNAPSEINIAYTGFNGECPDSINENFNWVPSNFIEDTIETEVCPAECDCPIPVTVLESYPTCEECLPIVNYKFTNCNNKSIIRYSIEDYSAYVGQTVELECGGCWFVSEIDFIPPSTQDIDVLYTFDSCAACAKSYYKLTNCSDDTEVIYTDTNLNLPVSTISDTGCECIIINTQLKPTCDTIKITYKLIDALNSVTITVNKDIDGYYYFNVPVGIDSFNTYIIEQFVSLEYGNIWGIVDRKFNLDGYTPYIDSCPFGEYTFVGLTQFESLIIEPVTIPEPLSIQVQASGIYNDKNYYTFTIPGVTFPYNLYADPKGWQLENQSLPDLFEYSLSGDTECPFGVYESTGLDTPLQEFSVEPCPVIETVISIKECPGCFEVELTREPVNTTSVTLVEIYTTCEECSILPPTPTPVEEKPKRKIKPGYSVPTCDIDTYEKITCKSSEILYKQVLQLRYGISNCCPEEDAKWLIKKELIDLVSLIDPDYICKPVTSCCNQPINDCGCNTLKTCNSQ